MLIVRQNDAVSLNFAVPLDVQRTEISRPMNAFAKILFRYIELGNAFVFLNRASELRNEKKLPKNVLN